MPCDAPSAPSETRYGTGLTLAFWIGSWRGRRLFAIGYPGWVLPCNPPWLPPCSLRCSSSPGWGCWARAAACLPRRDPWGWGVVAGPRGRGRQGSIHFVRYPRGPEPAHHDASRSVSPSVSPRLRVSRRRPAGRRPAVAGRAGLGAGSGRARRWEAGLVSCADVLGRFCYRGWPPQAPTLLVCAGRPAVCGPDRNRPLVDKHDSCELSLWSWGYPDPLLAAERACAPCPRADCCQGRRPARSAGDPNHAPGHWRCYEPPARTPG